MKTFFSASPTSAMKWKTSIRQNWDSIIILWAKKWLKKVQEVLTNFASATFSGHMSKTLTSQKNKLAENIFGQKVPLGPAAVLGKNKTKSSNMPWAIGVQTIFPVDAENSSKKTT